MTHARLERGQGSSRLTPVRQRELAQALAAGHLASLLLLLLPVDVEPFLTLVLLTGSGLALAVLAPVAHVGAGRSVLLPGFVPSARDDIDLAALSPGYAAVLSALKTSEIDIGQQPNPTATETAGRADMEAEQRLSGSAALMARVSHELRTPLNAVIGFSDLMDRELFGPLGHERYQEYVRHINDSGRVLLKSAEDTLALTSLLTHRDASEDGAALAICPLAANAWSFFAAEAARRDICLDVRASAGTEVISERRALRQILVNLFSEALTRTADGGSVLLFADVEDDLVRVEVAVEGTAVPGDATGATLSICLARHLLELQGATLVELGASNGNTWRAVTILDHAVQSDLFRAKAEHV